MIPKEKTVIDVKKFVKALNIGAGIIRNDAIEDDNLYKIAYNQGAMDVTRDILSHMDGKLLDVDPEEEEESDKENNMYG